MSETVSTTTTSDRGMSIEIVYQDHVLVVVNKPPGLLSVPGKNIKDSVVSRLLNHFDEIHVAHRLDMATSGLMVFCLEKDGLRHLHRQFGSRQVKKSYTAILSGQLSISTGYCALPLIVDWPKRPRQKVDFMRGKYALTHWQVMGYVPQGTLVSLVPFTGRSHQLRLHCQYLGHPILGDKLYNPTAHTAPQNRMYLHASKLGFIHPTSQQYCHFTSPPKFTGHEGGY